MRETPRLTPFIILLFDLRTSDGEDLDEAGDSHFDLAIS